MKSPGNGGGDCRLHFVSHFITTFCRPRFVARLFGAGRLVAIGLSLLAVSARGAITNSATLGIGTAGTNLAITYSMTTTQGWITLVTADSLQTLGTKPTSLSAIAVPPSGQGQFLVPRNLTGTAKFYRLLIEEWPSYLFNYPDLSVLIPGGSAISISGTGTNRVFRFTHLSFNGGAGPLEILPVYHPASGHYVGDQRVYFFHNSVWTFVRNIPVAGAFVFHAEHGHFHFPFASFGLYYRNPNGTIGKPAILSEKNGFCIADSFMHDNNLPNAGLFGNSGGTCSDPSAIRGLSIGAVDEYNMLDPGQDIHIGSLTNGRYWMRAITDPDNLLAESNENNNETHVDLTITGSSVTIHQIVTPVLSPLPDISLTSPTGGILSGTVLLAASTPATNGTGVRFLINGLPFGTVVTNPPYTLPWNTTAVPDGPHSIAAQVTDAVGRTSTTGLLPVTVNNNSTNPPVIEVTGPEPDSTVSAVVTLSAVAASQLGPPTVQFYVDAVPFGPALDAPPYMTNWNTLSVSAGDHIITATALDSAGLVGYSDPVTVTVDNSNPPDPLGIDRLVFRDTSDTMQTPAFSTTGPGDLLVAFVAYDGPAVGLSQTATVTGAGLPWQLAIRSNAQRGTSEIWTAKATNVLTSVTVTSEPEFTGFHGSLTVIAFTNASGPGIPGRASAPTGAPDVYVPGVSLGSWVFAVGNDWDGAIARTPVPGQVIVHQRVDTVVGNTFWVQSTAAPSLSNGQLVNIHDNAPTNHQWNYAALEVVATRD